MSAPSTKLGLIGRAILWNFCGKIACACLRQPLDSGQSDNEFPQPQHKETTQCNAHVADDGQVTLFDFDFCGPGWRAYDVATFVNGESAEVVQAFMAGYAEVRMLADQELAALPLFQIAQSIWLLGMRASYINEWGEIHFADKFIDYVLAAIKSTFALIKS